MFILAAAKATRLAIAQDAATGYAGDIGLTLLPWKRTVFGVAARNLGTLSKIDEAEEQLA